MEWLLKEPNARLFMNPTIYEAEEFVRKDLMGRHITGVFPIDENEARCFYDFSNEEKWPVFEKPHKTDSRL